MMVDNSIDVGPWCGCGDFFDVIGVYVRCQVHFFEMAENNFKWLDEDDRVEHLALLFLGDY